MKSILSPVILRSVKYDARRLVPKYSKFMWLWINNRRTVLQKPLKSIKHLLELTLQSLQKRIQLIILTFFLDGLPVIFCNFIDCKSPFNHKACVQWCGCWSFCYKVVSNGVIMDSVIPIFRLLLYTCSPMHNLCSIGIDYGLYVASRQGQHVYIWRVNL